MGANVLIRPLFADILMASSFETVVGLDDAKLTGGAPMPEQFYRSPKNGRVFKFRDLTSVVFGELTVKSFAGKRGPRGQNYWLCICSCGVEKECRGTHLTGGKIVSCGNKAVHCVTPPEERFWRHVNKDGPVIRPELGPCWVWFGGENQGYGVFNRDGSLILAHRYSWIMHNGPIPEGLYVCHMCDNPACVRPDHHFLGTQKENMHDARAKGRMRNRNKRLTPSEILLIRSAEGTLEQVAHRFGTAVSTVLNIRKRRTWREL